MARALAGRMLARGVRCEAMPWLARRTAVKACWSGDGERMMGSGWELVLGSSLCVVSS